MGFNFGISPAFLCVINLENVTYKTLAKPEKTSTLKVLIGKCFYIETQKFTYYWGLLSTQPSAAGPLTLDPGINLGASGLMHL